MGEIKQAGAQRASWRKANTQLCKSQKVAYALHIPFKAENSSLHIFVQKA